MNFTLFQIYSNNLKIKQFIILLPIKIVNYLARKKTLSNILFLSKLKVAFLFQKIRFNEKEFISLLSFEFSKWKEEKVNQLKTERIRKSFI